jgi:protein-S-isoprenylcysteine O-methyltransferase Ste14
MQGFKENFRGSDCPSLLRTVVAIALMAVFAIVCGFVAAVITGGSPPNFTITGVAFLLAGAFWFFRLWRNSQASGHPPT